MAQIVDSAGNPISSGMFGYGTRRASRHANLGDGQRPSESRNLRDIGQLVARYDRQTLVSASKTLYLNSPLMVGALNTVGLYAIGNAWLPEYKGKDRDFGDEATRWLAEEWYPICNVSGDAADFQSDMFVNCVSGYREGDIFELSTATDGGYPQIQMIPSHRIEGGGLEDGRLKDGRYSGSQFYHEDGIVYWSNTSRPVAYSFCGADGKHEKFLPAEFVKHSFDRYWPEQKRGLPLFWHSLNNLRDILQSEEWERGNLLSMSSLNYTIENETGGPDTEEPGYIAPAGCGEFAVRYQQGGRIMYARAGAGEKITQHQNFRPGNPWHEFYDMQARQCLIGAGLPASLWKPTGQGTAERADIGKAERFVEDSQTLIEKIAKWRVTKALAWAMAKGRVRKSPDWYSWGFTKPRKLGIDDGRTAKENIELYRIGAINSSTLIGERGGSFDEVLHQRGEEAAKRELKRLEMNKKYGIELEKRDFLLLTPNEQPPQDGKQSTDTNGNE